jgi:tetratricopeptide (TPR) repeat protein
VDKFIFVATLRNEYSDEIDRFTAQLFKYDKLIIVPLERFDKEEAYAFMDFLSGKPLEANLKEQIYIESEGNAFFVVEGVMATSQTSSDRKHRFKGILDSRFIGLATNEMKLLVIASMFFDEIDFEMLTKLFMIDEDLLLEYIQNLKNKYILKELEMDGHLKLRFTHHKLREHVYDQTPLAKRKILHNRIGGLLEMTLGDQRDVILYQKLIYHYSSANNVAKHLMYYLKYLKAYFDFSHELYPELISQTTVAMDKSPEEYFRELESLFEKLDLSDVTTLELKAAYTHMKARYFIRHGNYDEGMRLIEGLIDICGQIHDEEMLFKGYVQWFYYLIQTDQVGKMDFVLDKIKVLRKTPKNDAIALRLMGISSMMGCRFEEARVFFDESIRCFENLGKGGRYVLNIAACYNYISDAYRKQGRMNEALEYVEKAIGLCKLHNIMRGSSIFNTNAGMIAFDMGDMPLAKMYFEEALLNYETVDTLWKRSEAEGYLGVILIRNGQETLGRHYLSEAKKHALIIGTPETLKLVENLEK